MNKNASIAIITLLIIVGVVWSKEVFAPTLPSTSRTASGIDYKNLLYGFRITLPLGWSGYSVIENTWTGNIAGDELGEVAYASGPVISVQNPRSTHEKPYQDIPIMVFTLKQWDELSQGKFHIGAAPVGPTELGRNATYVLALPARYNYAFPQGYKEVEQILRSKPLETF